MATQSSPVRSRAIEEGQRTTTRTCDEVPRVNEQAPLLVGYSNAVKRLTEHAERLAHTDKSVLVTGESGTGKEVVVKLIHSHSKRKAVPLVSINCAAFPADLMDSELFGHEKGAFSSAVAQRIGLVESANGGTFFFDEIAELQLALQPKLLRLLQDKELRRLGSNKVIKIDVRYIAATNRNLQQQVDAGLFREDLQGRLEVCELFMPPLRERVEDVRPLVAHFAALDAAKEGREPVRFTEEALQVMERYGWPRNVRELDHVVQASAVNCKDGWVGAEHLPDRVRKNAPHLNDSKVRMSAAQPKVARILPLAPHQTWREAKQHLQSDLRSEKLAMAQQVIDACGGNKTRAAQAMGISRKTLYEVLKESDRSSAEHQPPQNGNGCT